MVFWVGDGTHKSVWRRAFFLMAVIHFQDTENSPCERDYI